MLRNAKLELLEAVRDYEVLAATITHRSIFAGGANHDAILKVGHTQADWETFLGLLDFKYDAGYGGQELYGTVWFTDDTWLERGEYDGSEWWDHNICPTLPDELLNDV
jgi:hypothetical protein